MASLVLLASDLGLRDAWRIALEAERHMVIVATTGAAAILHLREGGIDAVVLDYDILGGIEHLLDGLARLPDAPPLVLISGDAGAPAVSARLGAAAFLAKPCSLEDLLSAVARVTASEGPLRP